MSPLGGWLCLPLVLWVLLWAGIDTGPWNFRDPGSHGLTGWINAARAALPLVVLFVALAALVSRRRQHRPTWVEGGFWLYGTLMLLASLQADSWFGQAYWAFAFLAVLATTQLALSGRDPLELSVRLNVLSWVLATAALITLVVFARRALFDAGTGYGLVNRVKEIGGVAMSRASGLSRLAAVPACVALALVFRGKWRHRCLAAGCFAGAVFIIWLMQSRGSLFCFAAALLVTLLVGGKGSRKVGIALTVAALGYGAFSISSADAVRHLWDHATRQMGTEGLRTMSGRPRIWATGWEALWRAPLLGYGAQADRVLPGVGNAQNAFLYAALCAGLLGAAAFTSSMLASVRDALALLLGRRRGGQPVDLALLIVIALLVFNLLRSLPENNAALFSVDLLIQYPLMVYLGLRSRVTREAGAKHRVDTAALRPTLGRAPSIHGTVGGLR